MLLFYSLYVAPLINIILYEVILQCYTYYVTFGYLVDRHIIQSSDTLLKYIFNLQVVKGKQIVNTKQVDKMWDNYQSPKVSLHIIKFIII